MTTTQTQELTPDEEFEYFKHLVEVGLIEDRLAGRLIDNTL